MPSTAKKNHRRSHAHLKGRVAEGVACLLMLCKGFRLVARNQRLGGVEVDIIARRGRTLSLVEVKWRGAEEAAHLALHPTQRQRLAKAARAALAAYGRQSTTQLDIRMDVVLVFPAWPFVRHFTTSFDAFTGQTPL